MTLNPAQLSEILAKAHRRPKYGNRKTARDGHTFDSKREADRYAVLKLMERAGEISGLELQPSFPIVVNGVRVCVYRADFRYLERGRIVVEDAKGFRTPAYRLKRKLVQAQYGIEIRET